MKNFMKILKQLFCKHKFEARYIYICDGMLPYKITCTKCEHKESIL